MTTKTNFNRIRQVPLTDDTNEFNDNISEDDESTSDPDFSFSEAESDDKSTYECISTEEDSSDAHVTNEGIHINAQPESIEKGGVSWTMQKPAARGRLHAINIMKMKPGHVTTTDTVVDAFKLFFTDEILDEVALQTNNNARRHIDERNTRQSNAAASATLFCCSISIVTIISSFILLISIFDKIFSFIHEYVS